MSPQFIMVQGKESHLCLLEETLRSGFTSLSRKFDCTAASVLIILFCSYNIISGSNIYANVIYVIFFIRS